MAHSSWLTASIFVVPNLEGMIGTSQHFVRALQILVVFTFFYQISLLLRSDEAFLSRPFMEDSFYALSVARSISEGHGFSVDGVHPTNGVQPLICLLNAPLFAVSSGDSYLALRLALVLNIFLYLFACWMIAGFMRSLCREKEKKPLVFWSVFALVYANYVVGIHYLNGLETALAGGLIFAALWYHGRIMAANDEGLHPRKWVGLGVLLGLAVLARIDVAFLVVAIVLWRFVRAHRLYSTLAGPQRWVKLRRTVGEVVLAGGVAVLVSSPWWIYNYTTFGSLMPISGQSQQWLFDDAFISVIMSFNILSDSLLPGIQTPNGWHFGEFTLYGVVLVPLAIALFMRLQGVRDGWTRVKAQFFREWNLAPFIPFVIFGLLILAFYTFLFRAPHFQSRYLIIPRLIVLLAMFAVGISLWGQLRRGLLARRLLLIALFTPMLLHVAFFTRVYMGSKDNFLIFPTRWIADNAPLDATVGMFQSGTAGFVFPDRVVNLDGKVNSGALKAYQNGTMPEYVDSAKFAYIIDWDLYTDRAFSDPGVRAKYQAIDTLVADMIVWKRIAP